MKRAYNQRGAGIAQDPDGGFIVKHNHSSTAGGQNVIQIKRCLQFFKAYALNNVNSAGEIGKILAVAIAEDEALLKEVQRANKHCVIL